MVLRWLPFWRFVISSQLNIGRVGLEASVATWKLESDLGPALDLVRFDIVKAVLYGCIVKVIDWVEV
jgi:hypothetical protein